MTTPDPVNEVVIDLAVLFNLYTTKKTYLACNFINGSRQAKTEFLEFYYVNG